MPCQVDGIGRGTGTVCDRRPVWRCHGAHSPVDEDHNGLCGGCALDDGDLGGTGAEIFADQPAGWDSVDV